MKGERDENKLNGLERKPRKEIRVIDVGAKKREREIMYA